VNVGEKGIVNILTLIESTDSFL